MSYRAKAMALAKQLGAIVEVNQEGRTYTIQAVVPLPAPDGRHMVWAATGTHEMVESIYKGPWGTEELWKGVLESMQHGLTPCEDPNCEWFLEEPEDESNPFEQPEPPDSDYDPVELAKGTKVELEHTQDRRIAKRIAKDHLDETKSYYRKLATLGLNPPGGRITLASVNVAIAYTRYALEPATMRVRVELGRPPPMAYYLWPVDAHDETIPDMRGEGMELCIGRLSDIPLEQWPQEVEDRIAGHPLKTQRIGEYRRSDFGIDPVTGRRML